jgi:hypothetical protein
MPVFRSFFLANQRASTIFLSQSERDSGTKIPISKNARFPGIFEKARKTGIFEAKYETKKVD